MPLSDSDIQALFGKGSMQQGAQGAAEMARFVNPEAFHDAIQTMPFSSNIEDRRMETPTLQQRLHDWLRMNLTDQILR